MSWAGALDAGRSERIVEVRMASMQPGDVFKRNKRRCFVGWLLPVFPDLIGKLVQGAVVSVDLVE